MFKRYISWLNETTKRHDNILKQELEMGGKAVKDVRPLNQDEVQQTYEWVEQNILPMLSLEKDDALPVGSFGKKPKNETSGDIDIALKADKFMTNGLKFEDISLAIDCVLNEEGGFNTTLFKEFNQVSVSVPINGDPKNGYAQIDLMLSPDLNWTKFIYHSPNLLEKESKYKGAVRNALMMALISESTKEITKLFEGQTEEYNSLAIRFPTGVWNIKKSFMGKKGKIIKKGNILESEFITRKPQDVIDLALGEGYGIKAANSFETLWEVIHQKDFIHKSKMNEIMSKFKVNLKSMMQDIPIEALKKYPEILRENLKDILKPKSEEEIKEATRIYTDVIVARTGLEEKMVKILVDNDFLFDISSSTNDYNIYWFKHKTRPAFEGGYFGITNETHFDNVKKDIEKFNKGEFGSSKIIEGIKDILKPKSEEEILSSIKDLNPDNLLYQSANIGFLPGVKKAIEMGVDVHIYDDYALRYASENGHYDVVKVLLENGAYIHAYNDYALQYASEYGHYDVVELLLDNGANVHANNDNALQIASSKGYLNIVKLLLESGANVHAVGYYASYASSDVVELLKKWVEKDINEDIKDIFKPKTKEELEVAEDIYIKKLAGRLDIGWAQIGYLYRAGYRYNKTDLLRNHWFKHITIDKHLGGEFGVNEFTPFDFVKKYVDKWTKELNENLDQRDITVLYPGAFKPITGAHINVIKQYLKHPNVKRVVLFISPRKRDKINAEVAYNITKNILKNLSVEVVLDKKSYSPILAVYRWIENKERESGRYTLASSTKGDDYKRVKEFVKNYQNNKYKNNLPKGVKIIELPIKVKPLKNSNGEIISATKAREDLKSKDYNSFKENYPGISEKKVKYIWDQIIGSSNNKNLEETGLTGFVEAGNLTGYERVTPGQKYKSIKTVIHQ